MGTEMRRGDQAVADGRQIGIPLGVNSSPRQQMRLWHTLGNAFVVVATHCSPMGRPYSPFVHIASLAVALWAGILRMAGAFTSSKPRVQGRVWPTKRTTPGGKNSNAV